MDFGNNIMKGKGIALVIGIFIHYGVFYCLTHPGLFFPEFRHKNAFFDCDAGYYGEDHPQIDEIWDALESSTITITLSNNVKISYFRRYGQRQWDNIPFKELVTKLKSIEDRQQVIVFKEHNYTDKNDYLEKVVSLLQRLEYETIIIQADVKSGADIEKVIRL